MYCRWSLMNGLKRQDKRARYGLGYIALSYFGQCITKAAIRKLIFQPKKPLVPLRSRTILNNPHIICNYRWIRNNNPSLQFMRPLERAEVCQLSHADIDSLAYNNIAAVVESLISVKYMSL